MRAWPYLLAGLRTLWLVARLPTLTLLALLAPVVRLVLSSLAFLGVLMALFWKAVGPPNFPFAATLGAAIGCALVLACYEALLRLLSR
jgi:hypothetical protein